MSTEVTSGFLLGTPTPLTELNYILMHNHNSTGTTLGTTFEKNSNSVAVVFDIKCLSDVRNMDHK